LSTKAESGVVVAKVYRSWSERRDIIRSVIASTNPPPLESFQLTESETTFFRARSERVVAKLARKTSAFKSYYSLPTAKPFGYVVGMSLLIVAGAGFAAIYMWLYTTEKTRPYPLLAACATITVVAIGWAVAGWIGHRNTIRQNTNNLLFARFSQAPFGDALHRFHRQFGTALDPRVTMPMIANLRTQGDDEEKAVASALYLLNYYEFIAAGIIRGDFDRGIIEANIRGLIIYYYDKCEPYINEANRTNTRAFEHLRKLRTHYREP
jgi:hypothetical protein